jgi:TatD DNase family protein
MIDTHTHLYFKDYTNLDETITKAKSFCVDKMILVGIDYDTSKICIELASTYPDTLFPSIGLHPSDLTKQDLSIFEDLLIKHKDVVKAIGEVGLDYYHSEVDHDLQKETFIYFIELSIKYQLPLIIHSREAFEDTMVILNKYKGKISAVWHCFTGSIEQANQIISLGILLGIGGVVTFKNALPLKEVVRLVPLTSIVTETDCPFLAPTPLRGQLNEPAYVKYIVDYIKELRNDSNIEEVIASNINKLFKI